MIVLDTAALALSLGITPSKVRKLVHQGVLTPLPERKRTGRLGRPSMLFDAELAEQRLAERRDLT